MVRPYIKLRFSEIEDLLSGKADEENIDDIIKELSFRKSPKAKNLFEKIKHRQSKQFNKSQNNYTKSSTSNTDKNNQTKYQNYDDSNNANQKSKTTLVEDDDIFINFSNALDIEIGEVKKRSREQTIDLMNGQLIDTAHENHIYRFPYKETFNIKEDLPIILIVGGKEVSGTVVSFANKAVTISVEESFGPKIGFAQLKMDNSFLLVRLKERLEEVGKIDNKEIFNSNLSKKVLGEIKSDVGLDENIDKPPSLNDNQFLSLKAASASDVMYLWGPPGTGKTFTLAEVINMFYQKQKRILLVSNTNLAVDLLLKSLCTHLFDIKDEPFLNCSVLRFGKIIDEELNSEFGDYVNIDRAVERLAAKLKKEQDELQKKLNEINQAKAPYVKIKESFDRFKYIKSETDKLQTDIQELKTFLSSSAEKKREFTNKIKKLEIEAKNSESVGTFARWFSGRRSLEDITGEILFTKNALNELNSKALSAPKNIQEIQEKLDNLTAEKRTIEPIIKNQNLEEAIKKIEAFDIQAGEVETRLTEIQNEINQIKDSVLKNCKVVAATATQTYLKHKNFDMFDIVVIDESSMLPLPLIAYVAGLAKERVTVTGDFKQLPPIVTATRDAGVMKWIGTDIFNKAGIEKAVSVGNRPINLVQLRSQYRMDEAICNLINKRFYAGSLITEPKAGKTKNEYPAILSNPLIIVDTSKQYPFNNVKPRTFSRYNILHAIVIRNFAHFLHKQGIIEDISDLGIISPYNAQAELISKIIAEQEINNVEVGTVHRFQGNQKDIVLFDLADSYGLPYVSKLLQDYKLINVAVSRAKGFLVLFANIDYLESKLGPQSLIRELIYEMQTNGHVINAKEIIDLGPSSEPIYDEKFEAEEVDYETSGTKLYDQSNFDSAVLQDVKNAKKWVVIFSGFSTPKRIAFWSDIFRQKISEGVKIRCITRSPKNQGNIDVETAQEAIEQLVNLGVIVDLRQQIHEKTIFIDEDILWTGSLNPLSHSGKTEEIMLRDSSKQLSMMRARFEIYRRGFKPSDSPYDIITERENPACPQCSNLVVFNHAGRYGPYYRCDNCDWKENLDIYQRKQQQKQTQGGLSEPAPKAEKKTCSACGSDMKLRSGKWGYFYGCTDYPRCKNTEQYN